MLGYILGLFMLFYTFGWAPEILLLLLSCCMCAVVFVRASLETWRESQQQSAEHVDSFPERYWNKQVITYFSNLSTALYSIVTCDAIGHKQRWWHQFVYLRRYIYIWKESSKTSEKIDTSSKYLYSQKRISNQNGWSSRFWHLTPSSWHFHIMVSFRLTHFSGFIFTQIKLIYRWIHDTWFDIPSILFAWAEITINETKELRKNEVTMRPECHWRTGWIFNSVLAIVSNVLRHFR